MVEEAGPKAVEAPPAVYDLTLEDLETAHQEAKAVNSDKWTLFEKRFGYAWAAFEHHAKQRYTAFNFFIIFVGILASAYATLFKDQEFVTAAVMAGIAAVVTLVFRVLDRRNEELVVTAEDVLRELERDVLFKDYRRSIKWPRHRNLFRSYSAAKQRRPRQLGIHLREEGEKESPYRHALWFPIAQFFIMACFVAGAILAGYKAWPVRPRDYGERHMILSCDRGMEEGSVACTLKHVPSKAKAPGTEPQADKSADTSKGGG